MVKITKVKISKFQNRLHGTRDVIPTPSKEILSIPAQRTDSIAPVVLHERPKGAHVVFMGKNDCIGYDHTDSIVISIGDPERTEHQRPVFPRSLETLYLEFNPSFSSTHWFTKEHASKVVDLLTRHPQASSIIVHCGQGEYRSRGLANGVVIALNDYFVDHPAVQLFNGARGKWIEQRPDDDFYEIGCGRTCSIMEYILSKAIRGGQYTRKEFLQFLKTEEAQKL